MKNEKNVFESAKQSLVVAPITNPTQAFIYNPLNDLENLIGFIGKAPKVNVDKGKMVITFGKVTIPEKSVVTRSAYGEVLDCLTFEEAEAKYEIKAQRDYDKAKDSQVATKKPARFDKRRVKQNAEVAAK